MCECRRGAGAGRAAAWRCEAGNVVVEFALLLVPILMILFGFIEFGRYFFIGDSLANAAREGARMAIVRGAASGDPVSAEAVAAYVKAQAPSLVDPARLAVTVAWRPNNSPGAKIFVQVDYPYEFVIPGMSGLTPFSISKTASMTVSR